MFCSKCGATVPEAVAACPACGQPTGGVAAPAYAAAVPRVVYAGFWLRFVAWILDRILIGVVTRIVLFPSSACPRCARSCADIPLRKTWRHWSGCLGALILVGLVLEWLYYSLMESSAWQGTLGKKALGLRVTDLQGNRVSFGRATGRFFARIISSFTLLIGYIMAGFTEKKQALHDIIASCLVIRQE